MAPRLFLASIVWLNPARVRGRTASVLAMPSTYRVRTGRCSVSKLRLTFCGGW